MYNSAFDLKNRGQVVTVLPQQQNIEPDPKSATKKPEQIDPFQSHRDRDTNILDAHGEAICSD